LDLRELLKFRIPKSFWVFRVHNKEAALLREAKVAQKGIRHLDDVIVLQDFLDMLSK
jgi:hypothetical protein